MIKRIYVIMAIFAISACFSCDSSKPVDELFSILTIESSVDIDNLNGAELDSLHQEMISRLSTLYEKHSDYKLTKKDKEKMIAQYIDLAMQNFTDSDEEALGMGREEYEKWITSSYTKQINGSKTLGDIMEDIMQVFSLLGTR